MDFCVLKVFNNNVILAKKGENQCILVSKGIGFSRKANDIIKESDIPAEKKVFYTLDNYNTQKEMNALSFNFKKIESVTRKIISIAEEKLGKLSENLYDALFYHIVFATERVRVGLPTANPFASEIIALCNEEMKISVIAKELLKREINIDISEEEEGLIALHLYSAGKENTKNINVYSDVSDRLLEKYKIDIKNNKNYRSFVISLNQITSSYKEIDLPLSVCESIRDNMNDTFLMALDILDILDKELMIEKSLKLSALITMTLIKYI